MCRSFEVSKSFNECPNPTQISHLLLKECILKYFYLWLIINHWLICPGDSANLSLETPVAQPGQSWGGGDRGWREVEWSGSRTPQSRDWEEGQMRGTQISQ